MLLRWGICGCGYVSGDFAQALSLLPSENHKIVAAGASSIERANQFLKGLNLESAKGHGSYEELFQDPDVDVVYIGVLNHMHKNVVLKALNAGKHVLCEKPLGLNKKEVQEMIEAARSNQKFLMEGYWTRFFPVYKKIEESIKSGAIGEPKVLMANFGYAFHEPKKFNRELGGGCLMATGVYLPMLAIYLFKEKPESISVTGKLREGTGTDEYASITMMFSNDRVAQLMYSGAHNLPNNLTIVGGKDGDSRSVSRTISLEENFWCPTAVKIDGKDYHYPLPEGSDEMKCTYPNSGGFAYEAECVRQCIQKGHLECPAMSHEESLRIVEVQDEIRRQLGVVFPQD